MVRVTERMRYNLVGRRVEEAKGANARVLSRLSSQKEINRLSDGPVEAMQILRYRDKIANLKQFGDNIDYAFGFINKTETAIQDITNNLIRVRELAVSMANDTYDADGRSATAQEIRQIIDEVIQLGNSAYNGRYVFAGFRHQTPPITGTGEYAGDDGSIYLQVSKGNFRKINLSARGIFQADPREKAMGHFDLIPALESFYHGLLDNDKDAIHKALGEISYQTEKVTSHQATVGAIHKSLLDTKKRLESEEIESQGALSKVQDVDMIDAASEFKRTESVLQSSLVASAKMMQPSLLNHMK